MSECVRVFLHFIIYVPYVTSTTSAFVNATILRLSAHEKRPYAIVNDVITLLY